MENPVCLRGHDWHSRGLPPWNQGHIRSGKIGNGYWVVDVANAGTYEFSLRRWPLETGMALNASLPEGEPVPGGTPQPAGVSIDFTRAVIKAGETEQTKDVTKL